MRYLWTEDTGAGLHFWKLVNQLFFDNELVVESKGSNQGLLDAVIDLDIKTISELATKAGVSKPTIYEYINGKSPLSAAFIRLCDYLNVDPHEILIETETASMED